MFWHTCLPTIILSDKSLYYREQFHYLTRRQTKDSLIPVRSIEARRLILVCGWIRWNGWKESRIAFVYGFRGYAWNWEFLCHGTPMMMAYYLRCFWAIRRRWTVRSGLFIRNPGLRMCWQYPGFISPFLAWRCIDCYGTDVD